MAFHRLGPERARSSGLEIISSPPQPAASRRLFGWPLPLTGSRSMLRAPLMIAALVLVVGGSACRGCDGRTTPSDLAFSVEPESLQFRSTEVGTSREATLTLRNLGRANLDVTLRHGTDGAFRLPEAVHLEAGAEAVVTVSFSPEAAGSFEDLVELQSDRSSLSVKLSGTSMKCESNPCSTSVFDEDAGTCVASVHNDGTFCKSACLIGGHCSAGQCLGFEVNCDDGNPCTSDSCEEPTGCIHQDATGSCPAPSEACRVPYCDADAGCGAALAPDGTACESGCTAGTCEAGACVGGPRNCDDENPCTADSCAPETGCRHDDGTSNCPVPNPCQAPVCDPEAGCGTVSLPDGTSCGPGDCNGIPVCNAGQCVVTSVLDAGCGCSDVRAPGQLMVGWAHSCRITADKTVECWGLNALGELGDGTLDDHSVPTPVPGLSDVVELAETWAHTCARTSTGRLYCWGDNRGLEVHPDASMPSQNVPYEITELGPVVSVSGATYGTCAVKVDGTVWCWGDERGSGKHTNGFAQRDGIEDAVAVSEGDNGYGCAILRDTTMKCWGSNNRSYELGDGTDVDRPSPVYARTPDGILRGVVEVSAGPPTVVRTLSGQVLEAMHPKFIAPGTEATFPDAGPWFTPVNVDGCATQVSAAHGPIACARIEDGTARCFGGYNDDYGAMGTGTTSIPSLGLSYVSGIQNVTEVRTSGLHTCGRFEDGGYRCWGSNTYGELGDGTTTDRYAP